MIFSFEKYLSGRVRRGQTFLDPEVYAAVDQFLAFQPLFCVRDLVAGEDTAAIDLAAFREGEFHAVAGIAKGGDAGTEKDWMNVQTDFVHQAGGEKGLG